MADTPTIRTIPDPDPKILRMQYANKQRAGEFKPTGCPHPISAMEQAVDDTGYAHRHHRPTNMFFCSICKTPGRLVMYDGVEPSDG